MGAIASLITSLTNVYSTVHSGADQRKHQSCAPLAFVRGIHRGPVNSPHKWPVTRKMFPIDDVIMDNSAQDLSLWWAIIPGVCFAPKGGRFVQNSGRLPLLCKIYVVVLFLWYPIYYDENIGISRIRCVFGHGTILKSFIHWLLRYEPAILGWAYCPMLPHLYNWQFALRGIITIPHSMYRYHKHYTWRCWTSLFGS